MRKFILFALMLTTFACLTAQKTIFALWDLPTKGCSLDEEGSVPSNNSDTAMEAAPDFWDNQLTEVPLGFASLAAVVDSLGRLIAAQNQENPDFFRPRIAWRDDLTFFQKDGKWGLREGEREILITAQFDHVIANKEEVGFIGYKNGRCNYYTNQGKPYFQQEYLHLERNKWGSFIVRKATGFGLVDETGKELLPPIYQYIRIMAEGEKPYAYVHESREKSFLYHLKDGQQTFYTADAYAWSFIDDRYAVVDNRALIDLQKNRLVFCAPDVNVKVVDRKHLLFAISRKEAPEEYRLINHEGKLLSKEVFSAIGNRMGNGMIAAAIPSAYEPGRKQTTLYGLLDDDGNWAVAPSFPNGIHNLVADRFIAVNKSYYEMTLVSLKGDTLLPLRAYRKYELTEDGKSLKAIYLKDKVYQANLLNLKTNVVTALDDPGYWDRKPFGTCGQDTLYLATCQGGQMLLDKKGNPLLEKPVVRISKGPEPETYNVLFKVNQENKKGNYLQWVDCDLQPRTFKMEGAEMDTVKGIVKLSSDFFLVKTEPETAYFILPTGQAIATTYNWSGLSRRFGDYLQLYNDKRKEGLMTADAEVIMPPVFNSLYPDQQLGLVRYELEHEKPQYLQPDGTRLFPDQYDEVHPSRMGSFRVKKNDKWGLVDLQGNVLLPTDYRYLYLSNGVVKCSKTTHKYEETFDLQGRPLRD